MSARKANVLACDAEGCPEQLQAHEFETAVDVRRRARAENGWRAIPSNRAGGHTDLCRWHS